MLIAILFPFIRLLIKVTNLALYPTRGVSINNVASVLMGCLYVLSVIQSPLDIVNTSVVSLQLLAGIYF